MAARLLAPTDRRDARFGRFFRSTANRALDKRIGQLQARAQPVSRGLLSDMGDTPGSPDDTGSTGGTVVDMCLAMFIMRVVVLGLEGDQVQMTMPDPALGTQCIGKTPNIGR